MQLISSAFEEGGSIPSKYTCDGPDVSPPLGWSNVPDQAVSLALILDDPDAPAGTWVHWVIYDIPVNEAGLSDEIPPRRELESGARQGTNDFDNIGYGGPCPPGGSHRYYFTLYALDEHLNLPPGRTKAKLLEAMEGHILDEAQLMGTYAR